MSGIFGFQQLNLRSDSAGALRALEFWNRSYGHEGSGSFLTGLVGIGCHQEHLSDRFPGSAPVIRRGGKIAVVDAVLYNRQELIDALGSEPLCSDEALLLDYVEAKGFDALASVNGDFAGAVYQEETDSWTLFRDHSGVRPLFYYLDGNLFAFSTDLRGIAAIPGVDLRLNEEKLYLRTMGYNDLTLCRTDYEHIRCIHPASWTVVRAGNSGFDKTEHIYWTWCRRKIRLPSDLDYQRQLRQLITDAVQRRLDAFPGTAGCELSGGLDSSVIAILINRLGRKGCFYSWSFSTEHVPMKEDRDEREVIFDICRQEGIGCHFSKPGTPDPNRGMFDSIDPPYLNTRFISEGSEFLRKHDCRVVFSGHGGDEGVSHRSNIYELWYHREYPAVFKRIYRETRGSNLRLLRTLRRTVRLAKQNRYLLKPFHNPSVNAARMMTEDFRVRMAPKVHPQSLPFAYDPAAYIMQGGHRVRLDNVAIQGAENGVRYLLPFLDYRVLDYALSIPRDQFNRPEKDRYVYRMAFDDLMPQSLREVNYKDTPSLDDYQPRFDLHGYFLHTRGQILDFLDRDYWKGILDFSFIQGLSFPRSYTRQEYILMSKLLNELSICCAIQNVAQRSGEWSHAHE